MRGLGRAHTEELVGRQSGGPCAVHTLPSRVPVLFLSPPSPPCPPLALLQFVPTPLASLIPHASPEAIQLLQDLLHYDPAKRPTAAQVLQYPFFLKVRYPRTTALPYYLPTFLPVLPHYLEIGLPYYLTKYRTTVPGVCPWG